MANEKNNGKTKEVYERERIHYQWMLSRIQGIKSLLVVVILAMIGYSASAVGKSQTYCEITLLAIAAALLTVALIIAAIDAGAALFYNEKSQEGIGKKSRLGMYILLVLSAIFIMAAKIKMGIVNVHKQHQATMKIMLNKKDSSNSGSAVAKP